MKIFIFLLFTTICQFAFSQDDSKRGSIKIKKQNEKLLIKKQNEKPFFTFCGKSGNFYMTFDEFKNCKKELIPINNNLIISAFTLSCSADGKFWDFTSTGNAFSKEQNDALGKLISNPTFGNRILIENIQICIGDNKYKAEGMNIKIK